MRLPFEKTTLFLSVISEETHLNGINRLSKLLFAIAPAVPNILNISKSKKSDFNKFFKLPLVDYEYEEVNVPTTDYDAEFSLSAKKVTDMLSQLHNFGDDLNILCSSDYVDFKTSGNSVEMRVNIPVDDMTSYAIVENEEINLNYSLIYISKMCITNKLSSDIDFCLGNECPMKINYDLGNDSSLIFYIAPKLAD